MKRIVGLIAAVSVPMAAPAQGIDTAAVDAIVENALKAFQVPGVAVAVVQDDRVVYLKGHGVRELGGKDAVTPDTLFPIASVSKSFAAASVAVMVDDGKMAWDDPVRKHLDYFRLADPLASEQVTLRDLLCHRTGLSAWHDIIGYDSPWGREELIRRVGRVKLDKSFRSEWQYQNTMYTAAGEAAGAAAKSSWEQVVRKRLFDPLGMTGANFSTEFTKRAADRATPHRKDAAGTVTVIPWYDNDGGGGCGAIKAHARDMARWARFQLGDGTFEGKRVLSAAQLREQHTPQIVIRGQDYFEHLYPDAIALTYGLGWFVNDYRGHTLVWHGGNIEGWSAQVCLVPKSKLGIVLLTNLDRTPLPHALQNRLLDTLLNLSEKNWNEHFLAVDASERKRQTAYERAQEESRHQGTKPSHDLEAYAGVYEEPAYGAVEISLRGGALQFQWTRLKSSLSHYHFDTFATNKQDGPAFLHGQRIVFGLGADGNVATLRVFEVEFKKTAALPSPAPR